MIENDPALVVNLEFAGLEMDLSGLDLSSEASSGPKSIWSQYSQQSSQSSHHERETPPPALVIPTSEDSVGADIGGFASLVEDGSSVLRGRALGGVELLSDEEGFLRDADFEFDAEGNVIELGTEERERRRTPAGVRGRPTADSSASGRVRREHEEGLRSFAELEVSCYCLKGDPQIVLTISSLTVPGTSILICLLLAMIMTSLFQKPNLSLRWFPLLHLALGFSNRPLRYRKKRSLRRSLQQLHYVLNGGHQRCWRKTRSRSFQIVILQDGTTSIWTTWLLIQGLGSTTKCQRKPRKTRLSG